MGISTMTIYRNSILAAIATNLGNVGQMHFPATDPHEQEEFARQVADFTAAHHQPLYQSTGPEGMLILRTAAKEQEEWEKISQLAMVSMSQAQSLSDHMGY